MSRRVIDLSGKVFGRLTVIRRHPENKWGGTAWECNCSCGNLAIVAGGDLRKKTKPTRSCGCLAKETARDLLTTHGRTNTREFNIWSGMLSRCYDHNYPSFKNWGGRGIEVCSRWRESFESFLEDMGESPPGYCIDRIDNNLGYTPGNCRWSSYKENNNNRRSNRRITFKGETMNVGQWAARLNMPYATLSTRLNKLGWSDEKALSTPVKAHGKK